MPKVKLTVQEEREFNEAVQRAVQGVRDARKVLDRIGERMGRRWQPKDPGMFLIELVGLVAHAHTPDPSRHFVSEQYWSEANAVLHPG